MTWSRSTACAGAAGCCAPSTACSFAVPRGGTTALVGESGSGKTTVARILLGLETPTSGEALVDGRSIAGASRAERRALRRRVQPVFQDPYASLDPTHTVERVINEPLRIFGIGDRESRRARVAELLDQVALPRDVAQRHPGALSGGQRQRVAIARALAPSRSCSCSTRRSPRSTSWSRSRSWTCWLTCRNGWVCRTSSSATTSRWSGHIAIMCGDAATGSVVEHGSVDEVFHAPQAEYTRDLLMAIPGASLEIGG